MSGKKGKKYLTKARHDRLIRELRDEECLTLCSACLKAGLSTSEVRKILGSKRPAMAGVTPALTTAIADMEARACDAVERALIERITSGKGGAAECALFLCNRAPDRYKPPVKVVADTKEDEELPPLERMTLPEMAEAYARLRQGGSLACAT